MPEILWPHRTQCSWRRPSLCSCCCDSQASIRLETTSRKNQPHAAQSHWIGSETTEHRSFLRMEEGSSSRTLVFGLWTWLCSRRVCHEERNSQCEPGMRDGFPGDGWEQLNSELVDRRVHEAVVAVQCLKLLVSIADDADELGARLGDARCHAVCPAVCVVGNQVRRTAQWHLHITSQPVIQK